MNSIPTGWTKNRMKYCVALNPSYSKNLNDSDSISFIPMECLTNGSICPKTDVVGRVKTGYTFFADGDIIMAKVTPCFENGNIAIVHNLLNGVGFGTSELYVFRSKTIDTVYLFYYLQNDQFKQLCIGTMYGTGGLKRVSLDFIRNYTFYVPPFAKQQQIASFLDTKSSLIDSTIEKEREVIDKLKEYRQAVITEAVTKGIRPGVPMKESGVEWIGEIPAGWDVCRLKYLAWLQRGYDLTSDEFVEGPYPVYGSNGIIGYHNKFMATAPGITIGRSGSVGEVQYITQNFWPHNTSIYVKYFEKSIPNYIYYLLLTLDLKGVSSGSVVGSLDRKKIHDINVPKIQEKEQQDIADYLDAKCSAIDATIQKRELAIEKLTAYKQSLIYECVTGKREVFG